MNDLQHTATAALAVLKRVQIGLERIRTGNGSATLLPTLADQLRDAVHIIEMANQREVVTVDPKAAIATDRYSGT